MKKLVVGATGIIGNHIVRELLKAGHEVIAANRSLDVAPNLDGLDVERVAVDLNDYQSLLKACKKADWVFMAAAYYPRDTFHKKKHIKISDSWTQNIIRATKEANIQKLIYTSSLTTIGKAPQKLLANEELGYDMVGRDPHPYFCVKHLAEQQLLKAYHQNDCPVVIVNPTGCFGPFELKPIHLCLIPQLLNKKLKLYVHSDINVVDTGDVARGHILAAERGRLGERYILGGHNITTEMLIKEICEVGAVKPPKIVVPIQMGVPVAFMGEFVSMMLKKDPILPLLGLRFAQYGQHFSIDKAVDELGYEVSPMSQCYGQAIEWYKKLNYIN
ncbi:hypothetical protein BVY03_02020 [bacterium K02(2017)]|nr:hypothetical protein BVY03_02020 [bacterium K02(2017)]